MKVLTGQKTHPVRGGPGRQRPPRAEPQCGAPGAGAGAARHSPCSSPPASLEGAHDAKLHKEPCRPCTLSCRLDPPDPDRLTPLTMLPFRAPLVHTTPKPQSSETPFPVSLLPGPLLPSPHF